MKITKEALKQIIKEEIEGILDEGFFDSLMGGPSKRQKERQRLSTAAGDAGEQLYKSMPREGRPDDQWRASYEEYLKLLSLAKSAWNDPEILKSRRDVAQDALDYHADLIKKRLVKLDKAAAAAAARYKHPGLTDAEARAAMGMDGPAPAKIHDPRGWGGWRGRPTFRGTKK